jgi:hypothetical protein
MHCPDVQYEEWPSDTEQESYWLHVGLCVEDKSLIVDEVSKPTFLQQTLFFIPSRWLTSCLRLSLGTGYYPSRFMYLLAVHVFVKHKTVVGHGAVWKPN